MTEPLLGSQRAIGRAGAIQVDLTAGRASPTRLRLSGLGVVGATRARLCAVMASSQEDEVPDHIYKSVEITGSSSVGVTEAIATAVAKAAQSLRQIDWFEVTEIRGHVAENEIQQFQVT
jgi:flavin-binding protein dodecin